jgi:hypothetical protein
MAKKILSQQELVIQPHLEIPEAGFFGFGAKEDGLYQRDALGEEIRMLSQADLSSFMAPVLSDAAKSVMLYRSALATQNQLNFVTLINLEWN